MRAQDLAVEYPTVSGETPMVDAARLLARRDLPGLIVVDAGRRPVAVLAATEVLQMAMPCYCRDDAALARVVDEASADGFLLLAGDRTVGSCVPAGRQDVPVVDPAATALEIAAVMARTHSPLVAVAAAGQPLLGAVLLDSMLDRMLGAGVPSQGDLALRLPQPTG